MVVMGWAVVMAMQLADPTVADTDQPRPPAGPVDRKATEPVPSPAPVELEAGVQSGERVGPPAAPTTVPGEINVRSELGTRFKLVEATVLLDGIPVAERRAKPGQELERSFEAWTGPVRAGPHAMTVALIYEGRNPRVFNYMDDYQFLVTSSYPFQAASDRPAALDVVVRERKGASVPMEKRPYLEITPAGGSGVTPAAAPGSVTAVPARAPASVPAR